MERVNAVTIYDVESRWICASVLSTEKEREKTNKIEGKSIILAPARHLPVVSNVHGCRSRCRYRIIMDLDGPIQLSIYNRVANVGSTNFSLHRSIDHAFSTEFSSQWSNIQFYTFGRSIFDGRKEHRQLHNSGHLSTHDDTDAVIVHSIDTHTH